MTQKYIKLTLKRRQKVFISVLALFAISVSSVTAIAQDNQFQLAPKDKLVKLNDIEFKHFYDYIPAGLAQKHASTIVKLDKKISEEKIAGAITSKDARFDLGYYADIIKIGILPYLDSKDSLHKEFQELANDIDKITIDYRRLQGFNEKHFGKIMPAPTIEGKNTEEDLVRISLNGSGYNTTNAVNYARTWTQNGTVTRNQDYSYFNGRNDCTNFVSQVLKAGGISPVRVDTWGWDYDDTDNWYYANSYLNPPSWTWGGAHNQYWHLKNYSANVRRVYYTSDLRVGDVVMWDTEPNDGVFHIGHNTVVTKIENGNIYLTYHSNDREDEPISTLFNNGYLAYGWAINH